jgi:CheY-like chemotaxis protein
MANFSDAPDDHDSPPARAKSDVHARVRSPLRILVIDDEEMIGLIIESAFKEDVVEAFVDPVLALERAQEVSFDVIFCDLMMPLMTGIDVYQALADTMPDLANRFVLITGTVNTDAIAGFLNAHAVTLLPKPFGVADLRYCVGALARTG